MTLAIRDFGRSAVGAEAALFYFAGHGVQIRGRNYLLPVGQRFNDEAEVEADAVDVGTVLARMEDAGAKVNLLFLDACRTNPVQRTGRSNARGLAVQANCRNWPGVRSWTTRPYAPKRVACRAGTSRPFAISSRASSAGLVST
jgi:uncharacterized caspase-like protein